MNITDIIGCLFILSLILLGVVASWKISRPTKWQDTEDCTLEPWEDDQEWETATPADPVLMEIHDEWSFAREKFGPFYSRHEGFAVLHEEFDELKAEVWANPEKDPECLDRMRKEAIQVAAMALRFVTDCCDNQEQV